MPRIHESLLESVFYLYASEDDARAGNNPGGTGFIVQVASDPMKPRHLYGVTNWHVACDLGASVIRLNRHDGGVDVLALNPDQWEFLPGKYDVAVTPLSLDETHVARSIPTNLFVKESTSPYVVGDDVFMLGLFVDHCGIATNIASARFGNISMLPDERAKLKQPTGYNGVSYVADMHSRNGFSGSPVFAYRTFGSDLTVDHWGHHFRNLQFDSPLDVGRAGRQSFSASGRLAVDTLFNFLGIHWGQFPERWDLGQKPKKAHTPRLLKADIEARRLVLKDHYVEGMSGMTTVIPAWQILGVLDMPKLKHQRDVADAAIDPEWYKKASPRAL